MQDAITLAWAVRVDHAQLGARLEAYVDTKAAISTLRACIAHSDIRSMSCLPPELVAMIVGTLNDLVYNQKIQGWITAQECLQNDCKTTDHFTEEELRDIEYPYDSDNEDYLWPESMEIHRNTIEAHVQKITLPTTNNVVRKFARCKEIFAEDFGIRPYFTILMSHSYDHDYADLESAEISAYLAVPIVQAPVTSKPGPSIASYTVQQVLEPTIVLQGVAEDTEQRFKAAVKALRLEAPHTQITVKDVDATYGRPDLSSDDEADVDLDGDNAEDEEGNDGGDEMALERSERPCCHCSCRRRPTKLKTICLDCGRDICQGRYEAQKPKLMMLGSGELEAYSAE